MKAIVIAKRDVLGCRIVDCMSRCDEMELIGSVSKPADVSEQTAQASQEGFLPASQADVIFCFSDNGTMLENIRMAAQRNIPIIAGTTGLSESEMGSIKRLANQTRCVLVPVVGGNEHVVAGAIRAARWVIGQRNGLYDMQDVV